MSMLVPTSSFAINKQLTLVGRSRAGDGTAFVVPELNWMFDGGAPVSDKPVTHIFVTHSHGDHIAFVPRILQQQLRKKSSHRSPVQIYLPEVVVPLMETYLRAWWQLIECDDDALLDETATPTPESRVSASAMPYRLIGVKPTTELEMKSKGSDFVVRVVDCDHRVTCYGYSVYQRKRQCKAEYASDPSQIRSLIDRGIDPFDCILEPLFTFLGDTTHNVFVRNPQILETRVVVVECSFLLDQDEGRAAETKHMLWRHLEPHVRLNRETLFVLIHVSLKHSVAFIRDFFRDHRNVHPVLTDKDPADATKASLNRRTSPSVSMLAPQCFCFRCQP